MTEARSNEELTRATAEGLRWITLARIGTELLLVVAMIVLARLIPPSAFGMFAVAVIVQELAVNVPSEGISSALVQRKTVRREHMQVGLAATLLGGCALSLATLALAVVLVKPVLGTDTAELVALTTPWYLLGAVVALPMATLRRRLDFRRLSILALVQSTGRSLGSVFFALTFGLDGAALVLGGLVGMAAMVAVAIAFAPPLLPRWSTRALRDLLPYGGPAALASFSWAGFRNGDYAIIGATLGPAQAGFYWRGFQLAVEYQTKISVVMTQMAFPVLARTEHADAMFELRRRMVRLLTVVVFPALAMLAVLAPVLIPWLFGPAWEPAVLPTQILVGAGAATVVIDAVGTVFMASGRARALLGYGVAHFACYVAAVLFASSYGLAAVAAAGVGVHLAFVVVAYQMLLHGRADRTLRFLWDDVSAACAGCAALVAVALPSSEVLGSLGVPAVPQLTVVAAAGCAVYLGVLRMWFPADAADLFKLIRRVVPHQRLAPLMRRVPGLAGRST